MTAVSRTARRRRPLVAATRTDVETAPELDDVVPVSPSPLPADLGRAERAPGRRRSLPPALRAGAPAWTWIGIAVAVTGFVLIAIAWGQVAGEALVYRQTPYIVSAGLAGLGLVVAGVAIVSIAARQRDGIARDRQIDQLVRTVEQLSRALTERTGDER